MGIDSEKCKVCQDQSYLKSMTKKNVFETLVS